MSAAREQIQLRTKEFALRIMRMTRVLPNTPESWVISKQILRSATSVAANYRAAGRARSHAEFTAKMGTVIEESDETVFWLELLADAELVKRARLQPLVAEANELTAIFVAATRTAKSKGRG